MAETGGLALSDFDVNRIDGRAHARNQFHAPIFIYAAFKIAVFRYMEEHLQILVTQNLNEDDKKILMFLTDGPQSKRGLARKAMISRKKVGSSIEKLEELHFVELEGKKYRLSRTIISALMSGLNDAERRLGS